MKTNNLKLWEYPGKEVKITCIDGKVYEGHCTDYTQALDNYPEEVEEIGVRLSKGYSGITCFEAPEIEKIEVID